MRSLRWLPACEWGGKERNATTIGGRERRRERREIDRGGGGGHDSLLQYYTTLVGGALGPAHALTARKPPENGPVSGENHFPLVWGLF